MSGVLYLVGTPIGNREDISERALRTLAAVDRVLCEDTRHSGRLLKHYGIQAPLTAWHAHNEQSRLAGVLQWLAAGQRIALISDAGMPLISDPGFPLVRAARQAGHRIECIPGPTALITALVLSGMPAERFVFEGFLPAKAAARRAQLEALQAEMRTVIVYEAPHRVRACLEDIAEVLGAEREVAVARELTKRYESLRVDTAAELARWAAESHEVRGEFVLLIAGRDQAPSQKTMDEEQVLRALLEELPARQAARLAARICGGRANDYYRRALRESATD